MVPARRLLGFGLGGSTVALGVAAIGFFFAANWWSMSPAAKIGTLDALLLGLATAAALSQPASFARTALAVAGAVLTGVLFGVHGQIWQTGADSWELFAPWALFAALWANAARADPVWLVTACLASIALGLWLDRTGLPFGLSEGWLPSALAAAPLAVASLRQALARLPGGPHGTWLMPALLALAAAALGTGGIAALGDTLRPALLGLVAAGMIMGLSRPSRFGPWPFAVGLILAVVLAEAIVLHELADGAWRGSEAGVKLMLAAALMLAGVAGTGWALRRLFPDSLSALPLESALSAATAVGAWIAAGAAVLGWVLVLSTITRFEHMGLAVAVPAGAIAAAIRLRRSPGPFGRHVQAAFIIAAYGGLLGETATGTDSLGWTAATAVSLLPIVAVTTREGFAAALAVVVAAGLVAARLHQIDPRAAALLVPLMAVPGWLGLERPQFRAVAVSLLAGAFVLAGTLEFIEDERVWAPRLAAAVAASGLMATALWRRPELRAPRLMGAGALVLASSLAVPAGGAGLVGLTAAGSRTLPRIMVTLGFASAAWSLSRFYYLLAIPLDEKAAWLAVGAAATGVAWALVAGMPRSTPSPRPTSAVILACALAPMALEAWDARTKAALATQGREILLPLRPADPRSLIQGDFMALRYHRDLTGALPKAGGIAYLRIDGDNVARTARPAQGAPLPDEVMLRTRPGRVEPRLAPESFLFPEGTATEWSRARFAIVRVDGADLLLTGLADAERRPIVLPAK